MEIDNKLGMKIETDGADGDSQVFSCHNGEPLAAEHKIIWYKVLLAIR